MKKQSNTLYASVNKSLLADLTNEVKETLAFGIVAPRPKTFTTADLWNIRQQAKARPQRRFL